MASPQLEKGYVRIANELFERIIQADLNRNEVRLMFLLVRLSYGMRQKNAALTGAMIAEHLGINEGNARKCLSSLRSRHFVFCDEAPSGPRPGIYRVNKDWEDWESGRADWPALLGCTRERYPISQGSDSGEVALPQRSDSASPEIGKRFPKDRIALPQRSDSDRESSASIEIAETPKQEDKKTIKTPPNPHRGNWGEGGGSEDCLDQNELLDSGEAAQDELPGSRDPTKLASLLTRGQVSKLRSKCLQTLQGLEPVLVRGARDKLECYLDTLPPKGWQATPQRWASYLCHWLTLGVAEVQEKMRDLMKMSDEYRSKHGVKRPNELAIQIAARLCAETLAEKGVA